MMSMKKRKYEVIIDVDCDDFEIFKSDLCQSIKKSILLIQLIKLKSLDVSNYYLTRMKM